MTVKQLIYDSLRLVGVIEVAQGPSSDEHTELLRILNSMLDAWKTERLMAYTIISTPYAVAGYGVSIPHAVRVEGIWVVQGDLLAKPRMLNNQTKYLGGVYNDEAFPTSTLTFNPPIPEGTTVLVETWVELTAFGTLDEQVLVPQGYLEAIQYNLALRIAPRYRDAKVSPFVVEEARTSKANIKRMNRQTPLLTLDRALRGGDEGSGFAGGFPVAGVPPPTGGGGTGAVSSVFGRIGAVVALAGDYTAAQVTNAVSTIGSYADPPWIISLAWAKITGAPPGGGGTGEVSSVFGRSGDVVAQAGDYTASQVSNAVSTIGSYADPVWITSLAWAKITGAPATGVSSVFGRSGSVVATPGDYTAAQVTNAVSTISSYGDPAWITSLSWAKITGAPATGVSSVFGRAGAVVAATGDYTAAQVTNAVSILGSYGDPAWITSLSWAKITGVPAFVPASRQVIAGSGLSGGGALTADVTLAAVPMGASGGSHASGIVPDPGATLGATRYLREDATWSIPAGAGGGMTDPTTTKGDLIARGAAATTRLGVGTDGQVLTADTASAVGVKWAAAPGGAGAVSSVFTRTGAVVAATGDYTAAQVTNAVSILGSYGDPAWITSLAWAKITGAPATGVSSVFGRSGAVVAQAGDYTAGQVTNAVSTAGSYADPSWITNLAWSKLSGVPSTFPPSTHEHAAGDITSGIIATARLGAGTANGASLLRGDSSWQALTSLDISNASGVTASRRVNAGTGMSGGGALSADVTLNANVVSVFGRTGAVVLTAGDVTGVGGLINPLTTKGDIIARDATAPLRLGVGTNGFVLTADSAAPSGLKWAATAQTPWTSNIDGGTFNLANVNQILCQGDGVYALTAAGAMSLQPSQLSWLTPGFGPRFRIVRGLGESGGNSGSNLYLANYDDNGTQIGNPLTIRRADGNIGIGNIVDPVYQLQLGANSAAKPADANWIVASDLRLKRNIRPFTDGLTAIAGLRPLAAEYNGDGGMPEGLEVIGFAAQDVERVYPSWVSRTPGKIGGVETNVLAVSTGPLIYILLNAIRELDKRLETIEKLKRK